MYFDGVNHILMVLTSFLMVLIVKENPRLAFEYHIVNLLPFPEHKNQTWEQNGLSTKQQGRTI